CFAPEFGKFDRQFGKSKRSGSRRKKIHRKNPFHKRRKIEIHQKFGPCGNPKTFSQFGIGVDKKCRTLGPRGKSIGFLRSRDALPSIKKQKYIHFFSTFES